jgi:catechol 2,3-dioxygenase-like lactoylglutathione lyase family enzyme
MKVRPIHFVPDVDEALRFYEALGLRAQARARPGHWVELVASGGELGLHDAAVADDGAGRSGIQLNLLLDSGESLEGVERRLREAGFPPDETIVDQEWGRSLYVPGPGGLVVQIDERDRELYT